MTSKVEYIFNSSHVLIIDGMVQSATVTDEHGTRADLSNIGRTLIFVEAVDRDGAHVCMWSGTDNAEAKRQAEVLAKDFGGRVVDKVSITG